MLGNARRKLINLGGSDSERPHRVTRAYSSVSLEQTKTVVTAKRSLPSPKKTPGASRVTLKIMQSHLEARGAGDIRCHALMLWPCRLRQKYRADTVSMVSRRWAHALQVHPYLMAASCSNTDRKQ